MLNIMLAMDPFGEDFGRVNQELVKRGYNVFGLDRDLHDPPDTVVKDQYLDCFVMIGPLTARTSLVIGWLAAQAKPIYHYFGGGLSRGALQQLPDWIFRSGGGNCLTMQSLRIGLARLAWSRPHFDHNIATSSNPEACMLEIQLMLKETGMLKILRGEK